MITVNGSMFAEEPTRTEPCPDCRGEGRVEAPPCGLCRGTGVVTYTRK